MTSSNIQNIEKINSFFKKSKPSIYPITKHPLEVEEEYTKEIYITMLYTIATLDGDISEAEKIFIERITLGIGLKQDSSKYIKRALNIDEETLLEFLRLFSGSELAHNFFVDSLILIGAGEDVTEKNIEIISEYAEILKLTKEQVEFLTELALVILEQSNEKYHRLLDRKPENIKSKNFLYYVKQFATGVIANDEDYEYWTGKIEIKEETVIKKSIEIYNAEIIKLNRSGLTFSFGNKLSFNNVVFTKYTKDESNRRTYATNIENIENIKINQCKFDEFGYKALRFSRCGNIEINSCSFSGYENKSWGTYTYGGAIQITSSESVDITKNRFIDCSINYDYSEGKTDSYGGAICILSDEEIINKKLTIKDNVFIDCYVIGFSRNGAVAIGGYDNEKDKIDIQINKFDNCNSKIVKIKKIENASKWWYDSEWN